jgi:T5SS/PEP-CTERM-associated repeat protein/autotransporter-associated beta strand protein
VGTSLQIGNGGTTGSLAGDISGGGLVTFDRSDSMTHAGALLGSLSVNKLGAGTLTLAGNNSYIGGMTINAGSVVLTGANTGGGPTAIATGTALQIGIGGTSGSLAGSVTDNGSLAFNRSGTVAFGGNISGSGSVSQSGTGTLVYTGSDTHTGGTSVGAGVLQIGNGGTAGNLNGPVSLSGGTLAFNRADDLSISSVISGSGSLLKMGNNTVTLTGANIFTGTTTVARGTLMGTTASLVGDIVDNGTVYFSQSNAGTYAGSISGTGSLYKQGRALALTGASTYSGSTTISGGDVNVGAGASIAGTSGITLAATSSSAIAGLNVSGGTVTTSGALAVGQLGTGNLYLTNSGKLNTDSAVLGAAAGSGGSALITGGSSSSWTNTQGLTIGSAGAGSLTAEDNVTVNSGAIVLASSAGSSGTLNIGLGGDPATINAPTVTGGAGTAVVNFVHDNASYTFAPQLAGSLTVNLNWSGTTALTGTNTYTGGTNINAGTLSITSDSNLGDASGGLVFNGGALRVNGANVARAVTLTAAGGAIDTSNASSTISGVIAGAGTLAVVGNGSLTLTGANTYSGGTVVANGTLVGNSTSLQGPIANSTVVQFNQAGVGTYAGNITGSGSLVKQGDQLTITGTSTYTGATVVSGTLEVNSGGVVNGTSGITLAATAPSSATLLLDSNLATVRTRGSITVGQQGNGTLNINSGGLLTSADGTLGAMAGSTGIANISGANSLWSSAGQLTVGGSGSGTLTVSNGAVVSANSIRIGDATGSSGVLNIGAGGAAGVVNTATITGGLGSTSAVNFNHTDPGYVFATQMGGNLSVNLSGPGTTILTGTNTYTGLTTINSGATLQIGSGGTSGSIVGDIVDNGILAFNRSDDFTFGGSISGTGSLVKMGAGILTLTGTVTYSGTTTVLGGQLVIGTGGTTGTWNGDLSINSQLTFNRSDNLVYGFVLSGSGSVLKLGTGTLIYTGTNTYTGGTTINVGSLQIGNGGTAGSLLGDITNNANLAFDRSDNVSFGGVISGTGTLTTIGGGMVTLTGANTFTGGTVIDAGTLQVGAGGITGSLLGNVTDNGALVFNRSDNTSLAGAITGTGAVTKLGAGTLTLTGNNTYSGATNISGTLQVSNGGRIEGTSGITISRSATDSGTLYVTGAGSRVTTSGNIVVGAAGSGTMTVDNGASVTAANIALGGPAATLNIGTGGASGSLNPAMTVFGAAGAAVNLNYTDTSYTLASSLSNQLSLNVNSTGTTILTGTNTFTGGVFLNSGTLRVSSDSNLGGNGNILTFNGGTLQLGASITNVTRPMVLNTAGGTIDTGSFNLSDSGFITGTGALTKLGSGTLNLTGTASYSGGTTVIAGTLRGTSNSIQGNIANSGNVTFSQIADGTYAGVIGGSGSVSKLGTANVTFTGANTYTGATNVTGGMLTVDGSLNSPTTVGVAGTLGGAGTLNGAVTVLGTLAPGDATSIYGTLTVNGNVTFQSGSFLRIHTDASGHNSVVNVLGASNTVTLNGGTVNVVSGGGPYAASTRYTLVTAAGSVSGTFAGASSDFAFLTPNLSYDSRNVYLTLQRNDVSMGSLATGKSQVAVANYLDSLSQKSAPPALVENILNLTAPQATAAFKGLSGSSLTELSRVSLANTTRLFEMLASRLGTSDAGAGTGLAFSTLSTGDPRAVVTGSNVLPGTGFWARELVADNYGARTGSEGYNSRGMHTAMGFDAALSSRTIVGLSAVYTRDDVDLDPRRAQPSSVRTPHLMAYASHSSDSMEVRSVVGCGDHAYESRRTVIVGYTTSMLTASHHATECSAYAQAELGRGTGDRQLHPLFGLMYSRLDAGRYVETGGADALAVTGYVTESVSSNVGLRFTQAFADRQGAFEARAVWNHEFAATAPTLHASLATDNTGSSFAIQGVPQGRDSGVVGVGVSVHLRSRLLFHTDYNLELGSERQARQAVAAGVSYAY